MRKAFLIGATGQVGRALLEALETDGAGSRPRLRLAVRSEAGAAMARRHGAEPVDFDLDRPRDFDRALSGSEQVFLLRPYTLRQLMQGKQVIDAARRVGVFSIVLIGAHGAPDTPHAIIGWNFLVEAYAERSGLAWTHLRPNFFMENILAQRDAAGVIRNGLTVPVSWISARDIGAAAAAVLREPARHAGRAYTLAVEARSVADIAGLFTRVTGVPHRAEAPTRERMLERLVAGGREAAYAQPLVDYVDAINAGDVPEAAEVSTDVETLTGRPALGWERFVAQITVAPRSAAMSASE